MKLTTEKAIAVLHLIIATPDAHEHEREAINMAVEALRKAEKLEKLHERILQFCPEETFNFIEEKNAGHHLKSYLLNFIEFLESES